MALPWHAGLYAANDAHSALSLFLKWEMGNGRLDPIVLWEMGDLTL